MKQLIKLEDAESLNSCVVCNQKKNNKELTIHGSSRAIISFTVCEDHLQQVQKELNESMPEPELDDWHRRRKEHYEECHRELFEKLSECSRLAEEMWGVADKDNRQWLARSIMESIIGMKTLKCLEEK